MWWPLLNSLVEHMKRDEALAGVQITSGGNLTYPAIELLWDQADGSEFHGTNKGSCTIYLQPWVRSDSKDPFDAYVLLYRLQQRMFSSIRSWVKIQDPELGVAYKVDLRRALGDQNSFRPVAGGRYIITVDWKSTQRQ